MNYTYLYKDYLGREEPGAYYYYRVDRQALLKELFNLYSYKQKQLELCGETMNTSYGEGVELD